MQTIRITSRQNPIVKKWVDLRKSNDEDVFIVEGDHLIEMAFNAGALVAYMSVSEENPYKVDHYIIHESVAEKISLFKTSPGVFGLCKKSDAKTMNDNIIYLDDIRDPGNMGTILRSALAFDFLTVVASFNSVDFYNDKVLASGQGAHFFLSLIKADKCILETLKKLGYQVVVTTLDGATSLDNMNLRKKTVFVIGNEAHGVRKEIIEMADQKIKITMNDKIESLNAGVAASIVMNYHYMNLK
jgi:TrmH family RNA methyltransferase